MGDSADVSSLKPANVAELERRYIELLERRIQALEKLVPPESSTDPATSTPSTVPPPPPPTTNGVVSSDKSNDEKENGQEGNKDGATPTSRYKKVISKWNDDKGEREDHEIIKGPDSPADEAASDQQIAYIFRRVMDSDDEKKFVYSELDIVGTGLRALLKNTLVHYTPQLFDGKTLNIVAPFKVLVYHWDDLEKASKPVEGDDENLKQSREDLVYLMKDVLNSPELEAYFKQRPSNAAGTITYQYLWTIFAPGSLVYAQSFINEGQLLEYDYFENRSDSCTVYCGAYDWNGNRFQRYEYSFMVKKFEGIRAIATLPCYPIRYHTNKHGESDVAELKELLIERGRTFCNLCMETSDFQYEYDGYVLSASTGLVRLASASGGDGDDGSSSFKSGNDDDNIIPTSKTLLVKGKVIVDNQSYLRSTRNEGRQDHPPLGTLNVYEGSGWSCLCSHCRNDPAKKWGMPGSTISAEINSFKQSDARLLLCPPKVLGYALNQKIWCQFRIRDIRPRKTDLVPSSDLFDKKLQLDQEHKNLLKAFIQNHLIAKRRIDYKSSGIQDLIEGKGQGLAILLHGPPGVGKTLTAETVALAAGRPLLPISVAEIGVAPDKAEKNLVDIFADASRWEAVLLIDEADVFLEDRVNSSDSNRNALVSVLLRVLEYYAGIIILTTNRINSIDVAVQSRIHLAIRYTDLTIDQKVNIFRTFISQIKDHRLGNSDKIESELRKLCKRSKINGRQIRNIVSSAHSYALSEDEKLNWDHIHTVHEMTVDFLESLKDLTNKRRNLNEAIPID